ncbi:hypothetical protein [Lentzea flava]|uniref:Secreted protein n=1 Tax=Lentzea flava TaxID=103732 RepID=A0ABQ2UBL4_9PSEU|nr:hypothetical protein [Lentzea flava]MCP2197437.1 hypothetical protein [Lentzea flava]GGU19667.1 hypothetical protein GCM10010178_09610 [Lentzea flava]
MLIKLGIVTTGAALLFGGVAQAAEVPVVPKPPNCSTAVQIGSTGVVKRGATTVATITQFEGCGGKYGHVRVQTTTPFRASVRLSADDVSTTPELGQPNQRDVWTFSRTMNDKCTAAVGTVTHDSVSLSGRSGRSC